MRVIVLAAGEGLQLDGFNKLLLRHPRTGERVIEQYRRLFDGLPITVVVGYRAVKVMHRYPDLDYVYNPDWRVTSNSHSLALALDEQPCIVLSSDLFIAPEIVAALRAAGPDCVLTAPRENRTLSALSCVLDEDGRIREIYQGAVRSHRDPEAPGVFKISNPALLRSWRRRCFEQPNRFAGLNLPLDEAPIAALDQGPYRLDEVNTAEDYLRLLTEARR